MVVGEVIAGGLTMLQPITVYQVVTEPSETTTITDVLLGIAAVVVSLVGVALALGLIFGACLIVLRRRRGQGDGATFETDATRLGLDASAPTSPRSPEL